MTQTISKEILRQIVIQQKNPTVKEGLVKRQIFDEIIRWFEDNRVIILTGIRRSGKSTILRQLMQSRKNYGYVNFEDERFIGFQAQDFELLNEVLVETYGNIETYFFDEIQNVEKFELFVRRLQDQGKKIVITGSNALLLSKELGTRLTGRYKSFEIFPFSFIEYLELRKIAPTKEWAYLPEKKSKIIRAFDEYLSNGGFPEYLANKDQEYIRTIYENILYKDIIARYSIKQQKTMQELVNILATNISSEFTYNSIKNSLGLSNAITVKEYISYLNNAYLFFELQRFDFSVKKQLSYAKKIYVVDPAFQRIIGSNFSANKGKILENLVYIELKRTGKEAYYYSAKNECDFIIKENTKLTKAIQVCYELNEKNRQREIDGLLEVAEKFELKDMIIITYDQEEEIKIKDKTIIVKPSWRWMLDM